MRRSALVSRAAVAGARQAAAAARRGEGRVTGKTRFEDAVCRSWLRQG